MRAMTIGQVAKCSGVGVETVRFYERKGLLDKPPRRESGYRQYSQDVIRRIQFIKRTKDLGFRRGGIWCRKPCQVLSVTKEYDMVTAAQHVIMPTPRGALA